MTTAEIEATPFDDINEVDSARLILADQLYPFAPVDPDDDRILTNMQKYPDEPPLDPNQPSSRVLVAEQKYPDEPPLPPKSTEPSTVVLSMQKHPHGVSTDPKDGRGRLLVAEDTYNVSPRQLLRTGDDGIIKFHRSGISPEHIAMGSAFLFVVIGLIVRRFRNPIKKKDNYVEEDAYVLFH